MTREEHNAHHGAARRPEEHVYCHLVCGYGELSQYDPDCAACWLGHAHTWAHHDRSLLAARAARRGRP